MEWGRRQASGFAEGWWGGLLGDAEWRGATLVSEALVGILATRPIFVCLSNRGFGCRLSLGNLGPEQAPPFLVFWLLALLFRAPGGTCVAVCSLSCPDTLCIIARIIPLLASGTLFAITVLAIFVLALVAITPQGIKEIAGVRRACDGEAL